MGSSYPIAEQSAPSEPFHQFHDRRMLASPYCRATYTMQVVCSRPQIAAFPQQRGANASILEDRVPALLIFGFGKGEAIFFCRKNGVWPPPTGGLGFSLLPSYLVQFGIAK